MRISDWSSDVCASDLGLSGRAGKRGIATSKEKSSRPCFQARAAARLAITFCAGSAVSSTWRAASAIEFRSDLPGGGKHGLGMARHLHLAPDARHLAVGSDQDGGPFDAHVFAAIEALFHPHALGLQPPSFGIAAAQKRKRIMSGKTL